MGGWLGGSGVIIKLNSVQLQLQLQAGTELGKNVHHLNTSAKVNIVKMYIVNAFICIILQHCENKVDFCVCLF